MKTKREVRGSGHWFSTSPFVQQQPNRQVIMTPSSPSPAHSLMCALSWERKMLDADRLGPVSGFPSPWGVTAATADSPAGLPSQVCTLLKKHCSVSNAQISLLSCSFSDRLIQGRDGICRQHANHSTSPIFTHLISFSLL